MQVRALGNMKKRRIGGESGVKGRLAIGEAERSMVGCDGFGGWGEEKRHFGRGE